MPQLKPQAPTAEELLSLGDALAKAGLSSYQKGISNVLDWLTPEERVLLTDLVARFTVCEFNEYLSKASELAARLIEALDNDTKRIVLLPLIDPTTQHKPKSGEGVAWLMSRELERLAVASGRSFEMVSRSIKPAMIERSEESAFVLVDDFVGSGGTAEKALAWVVLQGVPAERLVVGCFVGLREGHRKISGAGARSVFLTVMERGISDAPHIADKNKALQQMIDVEKKNKISKKYSLGYEAGEALALMCFCPNNTFPVFWWDGPCWKGALTR